jgi:hypothetical protein
MTTLMTRLRSFPHWVAVGFGVMGLIIVAISQCESRRSGVWKRERDIADSTAKAEQRRRANVERVATSALARADTLAVRIHTLTRDADAAAQRAARAAQDARRAFGARDAAIAALAGAGDIRDSVTALLSKSTADDSVIAAQDDVIRARNAESIALRTALDSAAVARATLTAALDSTSAQLRRHGALVQQLQTVIRTAPGRGRFSTVAVTVGAGFCAPNTFCVGAIAGPSIRLF